MNNPNPEAEADGISYINQGMNSGVSPRLLPKNQLAFAINCTFRGGLPKTRPVFRKVVCSYQDDATQAAARIGLWQEASFYQALGGGESCIVASVGGHLFRYLIGTGQTAGVSDISIQQASVVGGGGFVVPAVGATVSVTLASTAGWLAGMPVTVDGKIYVVASVTSVTVVVLQNVSATPADVVAAGVQATVYTDLNDSTNPGCWMWQSEDFLVTQNGAANPLFFDGAGVRRSQGQGGEELPAGCMGCYVQGRNWMALADGNGGPSQAYIAGDLVYSHGFDGSYNGRDAVLKTTELSLFAGGAPFSVPVAAGPISGMGTVAIADTSLGQGALQVFTRTAVFSVNVPLDRATWFASQVPLVVVGLPNYGTTSQQALVTVNGDLWYRSQDGIRSYQVGRRDLNTWVNTPLSVEMEGVLRRDTDGLLGKASGVLFNNRLLMTCAPRAIRSRGVAHWGLVALDFNNVSTLTSRSQPAYDGLWTGVHILRILKGTFSGVERCFAFALDCDGEIDLWELMQDEVGYFDHNGEESVGVESSIETRSMGWRDNGNTLKNLICGDLYIDRIAGNDTVEVDFKYRSDEDQTWRDWHNFELCAPIVDCSTNGCPTFQDVLEQYRTFIRLPDPVTICSEITKRNTRTGYEFQFRYWWKGFMQWNRTHFWSKEMSDSVVRSCPTSETCVLLKGCALPWFDYSVDGCAGNPSVPFPVPPGPPPTPPDPPEPPPPPNTPPVWPVPDPYGCVGESTTINSPLVVADNHLVSNVVGVTPIVLDPTEWVNTYGAPGCLESWSNAVWSDFLTMGIAYSQAMLIWQDSLTTGDNWLATQVFPNMDGNYNRVVLGSPSFKIVVRYCP